MSDREIADHATDHFSKGFPWCDTCKRPAVFNEFKGNCHSTPEHPFGLPPEMDDSGHEVTMREWFAAPLDRCGPTNGGAR